MTHRHPARPGENQVAALQELRSIAALGTTPLLRVTRIAIRGAELVARLRLRTAEIGRTDGGLPLRPDYEDFLVTIPVGYPLLPPFVQVEHPRFVGRPHVLQGDRLCLFLDLAQEWHPRLGIIGFLDRLWSWLDDAANNRFDAGTALYHPVGGVLHATRGTPMVVVRDPLALHPWSMGRRWVHRRTAHRLDLARRSRSENDLAAAVVSLPGPLRYGAGNTLADLCIAMRGIGQPVKDLLHVLAVTAARNPPGCPLYFVLALPAPAGVDEEDTHLICGRLRAELVAPLRAAAKQHGPLLQLTSAVVPADSFIEWCTMSEERPTRTTRRDQRRPVNSFTGKHVVLWGCGGLGSWAGEFLARAGVTRLTLCDPAPVSGPLLVRQDYTESDVGATKADALARRLQSISDTLVVTVIADSFALLNDGLPACDVLIDATVTNTVAMAIGLPWSSTVHRPLVARISTDRATCTLGLLTITRPPDGLKPENADYLAGQAIAEIPELEPYRCFWDPPATADELKPAPGCSVPTFHGSAADLAAITATMISFLGRHLRPGSPTGSHLVALPYSHVANAHHWIPAVTAGNE